MVTPSVYGLAALILIPITAITVSWCLGWIVRGAIDTTRTRRQYDDR